MSKNVVSQPLLTDSEIRELLRQSKAGDPAAKEKVLLSYLPLATSYAKNYEDMGVPFEDLYQEACYGILVAMQHYDPDRKETFGTYASHYITKYIRDNALQKQNSTLPSCYNRDFYYEIKSYISGLEEYKKDYGRTPSDLELSEYLDISLWRIRRLKRASDSFLMTSQSLDELPPDYIPVGHVFRPVEEAALRSFIDIPDPNTRLTPREEEVLIRRCGFTESGQPESWAEISAVMGHPMNTLKFSYRVAIAKLRRAAGVIVDD